MPRKRPPNSAGTYGFLDVLRHPARIMRPPAGSEGGSDLTAIRAGSARTVSCFLRSDHDPYPRRLTPGRLVLSPDGPSWTALWSLRRKPLPIGLPVTWLATRAADHREPNVKKGGSAFGVVSVPTFMVITLTTPTATLDLVLPQADVQLVTGYFGDRRPGSPDPFGSAGSRTVPRQAGATPNGGYPPFR